MNLLTIVLISAALLLLAYRIYGTILGRLLKLDPNTTTPAVELRDDVDYVPIEPKFLISQHFSAIAAAGPVVGPILAGLMFGWLPALLWILVGSIFIGGVHDITSLIASIRHKARTIAEVVQEHMSRRAYALFLTFIWIALVYIIVAFTDVTASSFVGRQTFENGQTITGGGIATSSLLYLALPIIMGLLMRYAKLSLGMATLIFVPLVGVVIYFGQVMPFDVAALLGVSDNQAQKVWSVALLLYCVVAAVAPMWLLLQPRGHLGGYFLFIALAGSAIGLLFGGYKIDYPMFKGWSVTNVQGQVATLFPLLFITIACGACSGFHSLIASGTTSKQLRKETDARVIGYGTMLLEAMVAIGALACVMILSSGSSLTKTSPNFIYANGLANFFGVIGVPFAFAVSFGLMAFTTFVYDTLDVCTRLGRYILEELFHLKDAKGKWLATALTAGVPLIFLMRTIYGADGKVIPVWRTFWELFGASNQLLAALTLLGVTVWLWRTRRETWVWFVTGLPTVWMYTMSVWAITNIISRAMAPGKTHDPVVATVGIVLIALAFLMLLEAIRAFRVKMPTSKEPVFAGT